MQGLAGGVCERVISVSAPSGERPIPAPINVTTMGDNSRAGKSALVKACDEESDERVDRVTR